MPPAPSAAGVATQWHLAVVPLVVAVGLLAAYGVGLLALHRRGQRWPVLRTTAFVVVGVGSYVVTTLGFLGVYASYLRWTFAAQAALLLLVVPALVALGRPFVLAREALPDSASRHLDRLLRSRPARMLAHPVGGPAVMLVLLLLFLTPLPVEVRSHGWALALSQVVLPAVGLLVVAPIAAGEEPASSTTMALGFLIAFGELLADAIPGILLRLHSTVIGGAAALTGLPTWVPSPLRDQQLSGDVLWFLGEAIDLPFLAWLVVRWIRADAREAAAVDAQLDEDPEFDGRPWWEVQAARPRDDDVRPG